VNASYHNSLFDSIANLSAWIAFSIFRVIQSSDHNSPDFPPIGHNLRIVVCSFFVKPKLARTCSAIILLVEYPISQSRQ
jgi:hypothetical protein